jgi:hypothetical protein
MLKKKYFNCVIEQAKLFTWTLVHITNNFVVTFHGKMSRQTCASENKNQDPGTTRLIITLSEVQSLSIKREVVAIFKNAFIVNTDGISCLHLKSDSHNDICSTRMTSTAHLPPWSFCKPPFFIGQQWKNPASETRLKVPTFILKTFNIQNTQYNNYHSTNNYK